MNFRTRDHYIEGFQALLEAMEEVTAGRKATHKENSLLSKGKC